MTCCSMPGMTPSTFSLNQRSCCSLLSQISETVKRSPSSTKATWYRKPGCVFSFSINGGADWSYCSGVIPETLCRTRTAMTAPCVGYQHHPDRKERDLRQIANGDMSGAMEIRLGRY